MMNELDLDSIRRSQQEAAIWCDTVAPEHDLRTAALRPAIGDWPTSEELARAVHTLIEQRRDLLSTFAARETTNGRLLVCHLNESISSGESEAETSGFFDIDDRPPWDTWLWSLPSDNSDEATLLSWVPQRLEPIVSRGIAVNPYECVYWLSDAPSSSRIIPMLREIAAAALQWR
jgi:hypothetical protein